MRRALELLQGCYSDKEKADKLDAQITEGMLAAEKQCLITYQLPWDKITHDIMTRLNILRIVRSGLLTGIDNKDVIELKKKTLKEPIDLPTSHDKTNKQL